MRSSTKFRLTTHPAKKVRAKMPSQKGPFRQVSGWEQKDYDFGGLEGTYNDLKADRTKLSAESR